MILLAYRHGLRASGLVNLRVSDLDLAAGTIYCRRAKGSRSSVHPMKRDEVAALERALQQRRPASGEFVFQSERSERMSRSAFWRVVANAGRRAGLPVNTYVHLLRHSCGYFLANKGCDLRLIQNGNYFVFDRLSAREIFTDSRTRDNPDSDSKLIRTPSATHQHCEVSTARSSRSASPLKLSEAVTWRYLSS